MTPADDARLVSRRLLAFPAKQVYGAFSDPRVLAAWWGPHGSRNDFHEFELRPGGHWRFTMSGP